MLRPRLNQWNKHTQMSKQARRSAGWTTPITPGGRGGAGTMSWAGIWETQGGPASAGSLNYHIRLPWPPHLVSNKTVTPESWCINKLMWFFSCSAKFFCSWKITFFSLHSFFSCSLSFFVLFLRKIESHWYLLFLFFGLLTRAFWG